MRFQPLNVPEKTALLDALRGNADAEQPMFMGKDTSFVPTADEVTDEEVICAIRSVP